MNKTDINHEVRTSLNAIMGFAQILHTEEVTKEELQSYAAIIYKQSEHLASVFTEMLDLYGLYKNFMVHSTCSNCKV